MRSQAHLCVLFPEVFTLQHSRFALTGYSNVSTSPIILYMPYARDRLHADFISISCKLFTNLVMENLFCFLTQLLIAIKIFIFIYITFIRKI